MAARARGGADPRVGLAYASYIPDLVRRRPTLVDFVELPVERLWHEPATAAIADQLPAVLHCASLSLGGVVPAAAEVLERVRQCVASTRAPWVGEHLAFVTAPGAGADDPAVAIGYTCAPPLNAATLDRVVAAWARCQRALGVPLIIENPPQYFTTPGSTMDQREFLAALAARADVGLLLDLSHLLITARNLGFDPFAAVRGLPLARVREIHLSGLRTEEGTWWDDHGVAAPAEVHELLAVALAAGARPAAVTLEYNWAATFPEDLVVGEVGRVRRAIARRGRA